VDQLKKFYKNKKVFVTGHTGFKGSWLTSVLLKYGAKVIGYSQNDSKKKNYEMFVNYKKVKNIYANILDFKKLKKSVQRHKPDIIFHLAAQPLVSESYTSPLKTFKTNMIGSINIMEVTRFCSSVKSLVMITSDKCYYNKEIKRGYKEEDTLGGDDPYSASKAAAEIAYNSFNKSFFYKNKKIGVASARAGNVIGGGDWSKDRLIPDCIRAIIKGKNLIIRSPHATRPWQHVLEPISGYLILGKKLYEKPQVYSGSWNFGPKSNQTKNVKEVAKIVMRIVDKKEKIKIIFKKGLFKESTLLKLNSNKANKKLKWKTRWTMGNSIKQSAIWYDYYLNKRDVNKITQKQINHYFNTN
jgi:CDP-glucose 4,6-dehydratase